MKKITIEMTDKIFEELGSNLVVKKISGTLFGTIDEFVYLVVKSIKEKKKVIKLSVKINNRRKK